MPKTHSEALHYSCMSICYSLRREDRLMIIFQAVGTPSLYQTSNLYEHKPNTSELLTEYASKWLQKSYIREFCSITFIMKHWYCFKKDEIYWKFIVKIRISAIGKGTLKPTILEENCRTYHTFAMIIQRLACFECLLAMVLQILEKSIVCHKRGGKSFNKG